MALGKDLALHEERVLRKEPALHLFLLELTKMKYFEVFALRFESTVFSDIFLIIMFSKYLFVIKSLVLTIHADFEKRHRN